MTDEVLSLCVRCRHCTGNVLSSVMQTNNGTTHLLALDVSQLAPNSTMPRS